MLILGISAFYHDSAAALVRDGDIIAAAQEERFTRKKHDADFPANAIRWCLAEANSAQEKIDYVVRGVRATWLTVISQGAAGVDGGEALPEEYVAARA